MKGDFSRVTFDPRNHFSQVLLQQGRVTLDADPNEQGAILLHTLRTLARDLFGPYGGPVDGLGFGLSVDTADATPALIVGAGRYYVDGILCESDGCDYIDQPHHVPRAADGNAAGDALRTWLDDRGNSDALFWIYLDVWERHVTAIEHPSIREVALGGPDTCSRVQVIWQVRALERAQFESGLKQRIEYNEKRLKQTQSAVERARLEALLTRLREGMALLEADVSKACAVPLLALGRDNLPELAARIDPGQRLDDPCITSPESGYRGAENHLYRVEIHQGNANGAKATFKWSRDNGSVVTRWLAAAGERLTVANSRDFSAGQWVELSNDEDDLLGRAGPLFRIASVDADQLTIEGTPAWLVDASNPKLRRWDQVALGDVQLDGGAVPVVESSATDPAWIDLEDGIQIRFAADCEYRSGDYWLFPARVATGKVEWPLDASGDALPQPPSGIEHHYAPLGFIRQSDNGEGFDLQSCACTVYPLNSCGAFAARITPRERPLPLPDAAPTKPKTTDPTVGSVGKPIGAKAAPKPNKKPVVKKRNPPA
ncbi:MAG: hypothetical protein IPP82_09645 [Xanthomonadales bacterium]|nr:hypothetical protein [Xanthomonadales bacterium]